MNHTISALIKNRLIFGIKIGDAESSVLSKLGTPMDWKGKFPDIGGTIDRYQDSPVWFYGNSTLGIRVEQGKVKKFIWNPNKPNVTGLLGLPINQSVLLCSEIINVLTAELISYRIEEEPDNYSRVLAAPSSTFHFLPFADGKSLPVMDRSCLMLEVN